MMHDATPVESKRAAFFDVAGTLVRGNPWEYVFKHPRINQTRLKLLYIPVTFYWSLKKIKLIDDATFRHHWILIMAAMMRGLTRQQVEEVFAEAVRQNRAQGEFQEDIIERLEAHKAQGDHVILISGIFDVFVEAYARAFGADVALGSKLAFKDGICTGKIDGDTCNGASKLDFIHDYVQQSGLNADMSQHYAYADSLSDVPMLEAVGQAVATYPEASLAEVAQQRGWIILGTVVSESKA